ncbi:MAG: head GIN domain-containing protein [Cyclobacteriaceae bacterium]
MKPKSIFLFLALFANSVVYSQSNETRRLGDFNRVSVGESIELVLISGSENSARIETSGIDVSDVETDISGGKLVIGLDNGNKWWKNSNVKVWLTYQELEGISVSSSASVTNEGVIKTDRLVCRASSSGSANLTVDVQSLDSEVSSSGRLTISGESIEQEISVSSSGTYSSYDLSSEKCEAKASSSGNARISVSQELRASASSSGSIRYKGDPEKLITNSSSSGSVRKG